MNKLKNMLAHTVGFVRRQSNKLAALAIGAAAFVASTTQSFAQSASGNSGADQVIDGITDLIPIVTAVIAAAISFGFIVMAAMIGWRVFKKFWG